jgi:hypothetical protein
VEGDDYFVVAAIAAIAFFVAVYLELVEDYTCILSIFISNELNWGINF